VKTKFAIFVVGILCLAFGAAKISVASPATGTVEGKVRLLFSKGTEPAGDASARKEKLPDAGYPVVVLKKEGRAQVAETAVDAEGRFRIDLPPGDYLLDVKRDGRRRLLVDTRPFTVVAGQTVQVDLTVENTVEPM
jgi:hypothetical protein